MNHSGDAAEQIVRLSLEGVEVAAKITGTAAKEIATFIVAALKSDKSHLKLKGKARMTSMLKSGKALEIFSVKESDLQSFMRGAKQYGIVYCVLHNSKNTPDGLCDILVKADDAPKISRLSERFQFGMVDKAKIESEIVQAKSEQAQSVEPTVPDKDDTDKLIDEFLVKDDGKATPDKEPDINHPDPNPIRARTEKPLPSEPTLESKSKSAEGTSSKRPSVREELREIKAGLQSKKEAEAPFREKPSATNKPRANASTTHKQPRKNGKSKSKKTKER